LEKVAFVKFHNNQKQKGVSTGCSQLILNSIDVIFYLAIDDVWKI